MKSVLLAGEGRNELGGRSGDVNYQKHDELGVVEALLKKIVPEGWRIHGAIQWKRIPKYQAGNRASPEARTVRGLALHASRAKIQVVVFCRDTDKSESRADEIAQGIELAQHDFP